MGLHICQELKGGNILLIWKIEETINILLKAADLSTAEKVHFSKLNSQKKQIQWLAVRALLNNYFKEKTEILYYPGGQPYLKNQKHISISHSFEYVAILLNDHRKTGVDIQKIIKYNIEAAKSYFINSNELASLNNPTDIRFLHLLWSMKEAGYKYFNNNDINLKENITVLPFERKENGYAKIQCCIDNIMIEKTELYYEFWDDYVWVCTT